ncbi:hypothetical protein [Streptomyces kronopolitis]|uniref:hypothetical protein n=1 Tax=Streptomyces kronopolitis TaxID=1612435 RepID=UPI003D96E55C
MSGQGRKAAMPRGRPRGRWGLLDRPDGQVVVRCFSEDGKQHREYNFSALTMEGPLRDSLVAAFVRRTAPGAGLTSVDSFNKVHRALVHFDRYLATLPWPPRELSQITPEHFDGFFASREHIHFAPNELADLRHLLNKADGVSEALAGRLAGRMPKRPEGEARSSYSRAEFKRIADASRSLLRVAARRIRESRETLHAFRSGELVPGADRRLARRLELLDWADRVADVPRKPKLAGGSKVSDFPLPWVQKYGTVREHVSRLHLTAEEIAAGAVLLAVMTGENAEVILKTPAAHHRADGYAGGPGTAIVDLRKPRRGRRAYMNLALSEVPDWISIPDRPEDLSTRDELHTPFGLYVLLHELTSRSRKLTGGDRLLIGYCTAGGRGTGRGLRPISEGSLPVGRLGRSLGLLTDEPDEEGNPVPLALRLDLLRLTHIELHQKPVAQTKDTAARTYLLRNRGNITEYHRVVAAALDEEVAKARARRAVTVMSSGEVERARIDPEAVAAEQGLDPGTLKRMLAGELDTVMTACTDNTNSPHAPPGQPCTASFMLCLECECARSLPRHLPLQVLIHDRLAERREQIDPLHWASRFAGAHDRLADLLDEHDDTAVHDARRDASDHDRSLAQRFLNRELDLR